MAIRLSDHFTYRRILRFTLPSILMMIFTSIYGVVDGFFVSNFVGKTPFAAVNLIMPVLMILSAFGFMIGTGGTAVVSKAMGEGRESETGRILRGAFAYALLFGGAATAVLLSLSGVISTYIIADPRATAALRLLSISLVPSALSAVFGGYFVAVRRVSLNALTQVAGQIFRIGITALLLVRLQDTAAALTALAIGLASAETLAFLVALAEYLVDRKKATRGRGKAFKPVAKMALPLAVSSYLRSALLTLEHSLIPRALVRHGETNTEALASYGYLHGMALPLILYPLTPLSSFSGLLVPEFAESHGAKDSARLRRIANSALNTTLTYAVTSAVLIYLFSEELGYVIYDSYDAGKYIAMLAPVVPIMYLDHVADSILKGIGEHIYSMWVNIADACLSVVLVVILIPTMGIAGYAVVIIAMEAFNFLLSVLRLASRIPFRINLIRSVLAPLFAALASAVLSRLLFSSTGEATAPTLLVLKLIFAASATLALRIPLVALIDLLSNRVFIKKSNKYRETA